MIETPPHPGGLEEPGAPCPPYQETLLFLSPLQEASIAHGEAGLDGSPGQRQFSLPAPVSLQAESTKPDPLPCFTFGSYALMLGNPTAAPLLPSACAVVGHPQAVAVVTMVSGVSHQGEAAACASQAISSSLQTGVNLSLATPATPLWKSTAFTEPS